MPTPVGALQFADGSLAAGFVVPAEVRDRLKRVTLCTVPSCIRAVGLGVGFCWVHSSGSGCCRQTLAFDPLR